ncbi:ATP-binding cassette sub-family C member 5-like [Ylistrum balloti]|uniref:ATP-binding cassette sub-family C member 5-like n=1 Tax=Ylistrum balloti TaxID=509963 RepID=UPI002905E911|nr:ATP-binding cassette sub-family C member 5-like [Ylistrum balloti]
MSSAVEESNYAYPSGTLLLILLVLIFGNERIPVNEAGLLSYMTLGWLTPLVLKLFKDRKNEIREKDVWTCSELESCDINTERLESIWIDELQKFGRQKSSLLRVWLKFIWLRLSVAVISLCLSAVVTFLLTGYITVVIIRYIEGADSSLSFVIGISVVSIIGHFLRSCLYTFVLFYGTQTGIRFRAAVLGMTFKKLLKLKNMNGKIVSEVITIYGSDALRMYLNTPLVVYLITLPVFLIIGTAYIYHLIGLWGFVALATFIVFYIIQIRKMNEVLSSMKLIKMYAWEESFKKSIIDIRNSETKPLLQMSILNLISNAIIPITPSLATVATISAYVNAGNELTASTGFSIVATLAFLRIVVAYVPYAGRIFGETMISFERIKRFMLEDEFEPPNRKVVNPNNDIELRDTVLMWGTENNNTSQDNPMFEDTTEPIDLTSTQLLVFRNISMTVTKGKHIGICGAVGSGKSSLLQALIGRMPLLSGHLAVAGSVAYAAQQAWIFNGTLRENVLFGRPYKREWYNKVLHACSLDPDLKILANGDMTEIGDRGINISGGQKQRVSLARAVYSKKDIYLLDDPLSAVDVQVGQHLFHRCIDKVLKNKTVVLVTHQLQYLKHCDEIYVMDDGQIIEYGTHESLFTKNGHYTKLMKQFNCNEDSTDIDEKTPDEGRTDPDKSFDTTMKEQRAVYNESKNYYNRYEKGILTDRETSKAGDISVDAYLNYIREAGGKAVAAFVLLLYVLVISAVAFSEWWLGIWIQRTTTDVQGIFLVECNTTDANFSLSESVSTPTTPPSNISLYFEIEESMEDTDWYLIVYIATTAGIAGLAVVKGVVSAVVMIRASVNLHNTVVGRVMSAPMQYFDVNPTGRILNRFSRDVEDADIFIPNLTDNLLQALFLIIASLVSTAYNFPSYLIVVIPVVVFVYIVKTIATVPIRNLKRLENVVRSPLLSHVNTSCNGLSTIVSFAQENNFMERCKEYSDNTSVGLFLFESCVRWMGLRIDLGGSILAIVTTVIVLATKGTLSPALAALSLTMSINSLEVEKETGDSRIEEKWATKGRIKFSNVLMKYRRDMDPVLKNISFDILPKQKVGIVGRTGAGKSSLTAALFRLSDLSEGHVYIDDIDIRTISKKLLRSKLSSIPQDPVLFAGTLRYNLDPFGKYTDEKLWAALDQAHIKEKMKLLGQTLDTQIQENGENFSVGERQLICLARAILRQNKILVLDEATASIDTSTDAMIQQTIRDSFCDCTVLTIAHRLNTVLHCDVIIVMEAGQVIEIGNPQALLRKTSSHFNSMIQAQKILSDNA